MAADERRTYTPGGPILRAFHRSPAFVRGIRGPIGSGKSTGCVLEMLRKAKAQEPGKDGKRRTRWAVIRNSYPELKTTTIRTWNEWVPRHYGKMVMDSPIRHHIQDGDLDMEVLFLALDKEDDVRKLLSLELTGAWVNEAREVSKTLVDALTQGEQFVNFSPQMRFQRQEVLIAHSLTLGGIGMDLGPIETDVAQLQHPSHLGQHQHLDEQILEFGQEGFAKGGQGIMIGVQVAGDKAKGDGLVGGAFNLARTEHAGSVAVEQQGEQDFGRVGRPTARCIARIDGRQVEVRNRVDHEARQVARREAVAQSHGHVQRRVVVSGFECSFHTS